MAASCVVFVSILLCFTSIATAQSRTEYPLCHANTFVFGEVPDLPFTAQLVEGERKIQQGGKDFALTSSELPFGLVARDHRGICDPVNNTSTTARYHTPEQPSGPDVPMAGAEGYAQVRPPQKSNTTVTFTWWHRAVDGRENLGPETFEGEPAFRYRMKNTRDDGSIHEIVNADELFVQMAQITWKTYPDSEDEIHLTDLRRVEPSAALFALPPGLHVSQSSSQRAESR